MITDASNLERIKGSRHDFQERPHLMGPDLSVSLCAYQNYYEKTVISTNAGDMGNAHSEYLSALSEMEVGLAFLFFLLLLITVFFNAIVCIPS